MELSIQAIEEVDLPNYIETIWSGNDSYEREAPLIAKYRVDLATPGGKIELFFEIRDTPSGIIQLDEYYEDQVFSALMTLLLPIQNEKLKGRAYGYLNDQIYEAVYGAFMSSELSLPIKLILPELPNRD